MISEVGQPRSSLQSASLLGVLIATSGLIESFSEKVCLDDVADCIERR